MRSLVSGGAGFIGSHLVDALLAAGDDVLVVDDLSTGRRANLGGADEHEAMRFVHCDITDAAALARAIGEFDPERSFHLAAQASVRRAGAEPGFDAETNVIGTINLLEGLRGRDPGPLVFVSTGGAIYGEGAERELPIAEDAPIKPETAYGVSKLAGEHYVDLYRRAYGMPARVVRLGNVYGPRQDPDGEAGVVAIFCGRLRAGRAPTIFGDGRQTRDYVFVADVVGAILAAAERPREPGETGVYNVGTGRETSVLELAEQLGAIAGREIEPVHEPARPGEVLRIAIDPGAAERVLGWRAGTSLEAGLRATYEALAEEA